MTKQQRLELMESGPIGKALYLLGYPAVIGLLSGAVYNLVDSIFIGFLDDTAAIGAAAVVFPIFLLISALGLGFGIGAGSAISRLLGAAKHEEANKVAATAFFSVLVAGILFSIVGVIFIDHILVFFGATETILEKARIYGTVIIGFSFFRILNMFMNNIIRSEGAASYSGRAMLIGSVLNMLLDPLFMFALGMGLRGAAVATVIAQGIVTCYLLRFFISGRGIISIHPRYVALLAWIFKEIFTIGIPTFIRQSLVSVSMGLLNSAAASFGDEVIASVGIVIRLNALIIMVNFGIGQGLQPLVGYNYGAGQFARVRRTFIMASRASTIYSVCIALLFFIFAPWIIFVFSRDPEVIAYGARYLRYMSATLWILGFQTISSYLFQALGRARETTLLATARQGLFLIPLVLTLPRFFGVTGVFLSQPLADLFSTILSVYLVVVHMKKLREMERLSLAAAEEEAINASIH